MHTEEASSVRQMFVGRYHHTVNAKHQTSIPSGLRRQIPEGQILHFVRFKAACLFLLTDDGVDRITSKVYGKTGVFDEDFRRMFTSDILPAEIDAQGRILVPKDVREQYGLKGEVVFVGAGSRIELWARDRWDKFVKKHRPDYQRKLTRIMDDVFAV